MFLFKVYKYLNFSIHLSFSKLILKFYFSNLTNHKLPSKYHQIYPKHLIKHYRNLIILFHLFIILKILKNFRYWKNLKVYFLHQNRIIMLKFLFHWISIKFELLIIFCHYLYFIKIFDLIQSIYDLIHKILTYLLR